MDNTKSKENIEKRMAICFLGLPASGKGTQADLLAKKIKAKNLGMGDMIREEINTADMNDPFYKSIKERYEKGTPQPDEIVADIVKKNISKFNQNIILDNFPFSKNQTDLFIQVCKDLNISNPILIIIQITKEESQKRILSRKVCSNCGTIYIDDGSQICEKCGGALVSRSDDKEETLKNRLSEYWPRIEEVKNYFAKYGKVIVIDGEKSISQVESEINRKLFHD
jgi:adenylate kinase